MKLQGSCNELCLYPTNDYLDAAASPPYEGSSAAQMVGRTFTTEYESEVRRRSGRF